MSKKAYIHIPSKNAMQSGFGNKNKWLLEFIPENDFRVEPVMGWVASGDTSKQAKLWFDSQEDAEKYAKSHDIEYIISPPSKRMIQPKSYANNFKYKPQASGEW